MTECCVPATDKQLPLMLTGVMEAITENQQKPFIITEAVKYNQDKKWLAKLRY